MGDHLSWGVQWLKARGCAAAPKREDLLPAACGLIRALAELVLENEDWEVVGNCDCQREEDGAQVFAVSIWLYLNNQRVKRLSLQDYE